MLGVYRAVPAKKKSGKQWTNSKMSDEGEKCEHGGKEGPEKYSNSTNPHICERNMGLD